MVTLSVYVDDCSLEATSPSQRAVAIAVVGANNSLTGILQDELLLEVFAKKSGCIASSFGIGKRTAAGTRGALLQPWRHAKSWVLDWPAAG